jgi:2-hydroxymuconate-semialdehyde hydrolase
MSMYRSHFVRAGGIMTHYLEAGEGFPLVLLHSGEFGGCSELSWERNIYALAQHFRVIAPDWAGFGKTEKVFSFDNMWKYRVDHITAFLRVMGIERAHFMGNSMGGTMLLSTIARKDCPWPVEKAVVISGGGDVPENEARNVLNSYDGTRDHMRRIVEVMFVNPAIRNDEEYIDRRHQLSIEPGAWECTAAVRFKAPWRQASGGMPAKPDYSDVRIPVLLVTGAQDPLRAPGFGPRLQRDVPGAQLHVFENAAHCPHIDEAEGFNSIAIDFLK